MEKQKCIEIIKNTEKILIVQDIDGVCVPLVKDPLKRKIRSDYIKSASKLKGEFYVLTCGEHEGFRGVNRLIEKSLDSIKQPLKEGMYLPGLAGCGVEYQDNFANISLLGLTKEEIDFLKIIPIKMKKLLLNKLKEIFPNISNHKVKKLIDVAICDTRFTPTINLNEILLIAKDDLKMKIKLQSMMLDIMNNLLDLTKGTELEDSFYLHIMPNIGKSNNKELIKFATIEDIGTTDIQFIINGAIKESGLLVLLNQYIANISGEFPFGEGFNVRTAPKNHKELIDLCVRKISRNDMPLIIGVGDTVTSRWDDINKEWQRGGSDRGFLTLIQQLGKRYKKDNKIIFVNSSNDEVRRPSITSKSMKGISDDKDILKFNEVMMNGPNEYIEWFKIIANSRHSKSL
tara:strand:- start:414 stop:1616 length:1203 start_codon:yes stop_codon:yes gene_type:complete